MYFSGMFMFKYLFLLTILSSQIAHANLSRDLFTFKKSKTEYDLSRLLKRASYQEFYFATIPWIKEYLVKSKTTFSKSFDRTLEIIFDRTGVKPFEVFDYHLLKRTRNNAIEFIKAKKMFHLQNYKESLKHIEKISPISKFYPFALHIKAAIHAQKNKNQLSFSVFRECVEVSKNALKVPKETISEKQLMINRDVCTVGMARTLFALEEYKRAEEVYQSISKKSLIWPKILIEEGWNYYYLKKYNRTLGRLVSYNAPFLNYILNPQIEILKALSYNKLCLWSDVEKEVNQFYKKYNPAVERLADILSKHKNDWKLFYGLMVRYEDKTSKGNSFLNRILGSIQRDSAYIEIKNGFINIVKELRKVKTMRNSALKRELVLNLKEVVSTQRNILGGYVYGLIHSKYTEIKEAMKGMSYIKLDVLAKKKRALYKIDLAKGEKNKRGSEEHLSRTRHQYFWSFNKEFWADELGDYIFGLKSECSVV